jgi:integrase
MATIHRRELRSGELVWELTHGTGKERRRFLVGRTKEEAEEALRQFNRQLALHGASPAMPTVTDAIATYVQFLQNNRKPSTTRRYERVLRTFNRCFLQQCHPHVQRLRDIKPVHVEDYKVRRSEGRVAEVVNEEDEIREAALRREQEEKPKASARRDNAKYGWLGRKKFRPVVTKRTLNYELRALSTFFIWAVKHNLLVVNPASLVERYRIPKKALPKFLTADEIKRLLAACGEDDRRLFSSILLTGMRKGEVEHLTWKDISLDLGVIFIQEHPELNWSPKTDERLIPISTVLRDVLVEQYANRRSETFVFANHEGGKDTHILEKLKKNCRRAGIRPVTVHALRHSFGAHLRMAGVSLADIADLLGHRDLATTSIYAKVQQEHLRAAVSKLSGVVEGETTAIEALSTKAKRLLPESNES